MSDFMTDQKVSAHSVVHLCDFGSRLHGTGLLGNALFRDVPGGSGRPTALAAAPVGAPASACALAGEGAQAYAKRRQSMRAFRGLKPWRDPA